LRPLFDDLQTAAWCVEAQAAPNGKVEVAVAIKLDTARAQIWQAGLKPFFPTAAFKSQNGWLIFDSDPSLLKLGDNLAGEISTPMAGWFYFDVNWPRLAQWMPELKDLGLPETQFTVTAPDENFHLNGKLYFPENLALNLESWQIPTNLFHPPFTSFTAMRGFSTWFQGQKWAQPFQITPVPNQLFVWSLPSTPFQTFAAAPVPDAMSALSQVYVRLQSVLASANATGTFLKTISEVKTNNEIEYFGYPFVFPSTWAMHLDSGQFLFQELYPNLPRGVPLPPELYSRLDDKDRVYYHWEKTAARMPQVLQLSQLGLMFSDHRQLGGTSAANNWLQKIGPGLGTTETLITRNGPAELTFERHAPGLLTAVEFYALANWLEATNFPGCNLKLPPRPPGGIPNHSPTHASAPQIITLPAPGH
jgi:hypothetical protein